MANYYTKVSFSLGDLQDAEREKLSAALADLTTVLTPEEIEQHDAFPEALDCYTFDGECIYSEDANYLEVLALVIQLTCPSVLPIAFEYSFDCSKPRTDAFGGGACVITADSYDFKTTNALIREMLWSSIKVGDFYRVNKPQRGDDTTAVPAGEIWRVVSVEPYGITFGHPSGHTICLDENDVWMLKPVSPPPCT